MAKGRGKGQKPEAYRQYKTIAAIETVLTIPTIATSTYFRRSNVSALPLIIVAQINAKPGMEVRMQNDLLSLLEPTRAEPGCITFDLLQDINDPTAFVLYEIWKDQEALDMHFQQPYVIRVFNAYEETLAKPIVVTSVRNLDPSVPRSQSGD